MTKSLSTGSILGFSGQRRFKRHALGTVGAAALCFTAQLAYAQDVAQNTPAAEEVTVTGTRVQRDGYNAPTPVTVVGTEAIQAEAPANLADFVNQLPSVIGSETPNNSEGSISSGGAGVNALNLRNLGVTRTLVLLDGHRSAASLSTGEVDINTFPQQLVKRIDVVTGGAGADYGSDAVSGVVNFILDDKYTGFKTDLEYGETTYGDQPNYKGNATYGTDFDGGRGHALLSGELFTSQGIRGNPRPWAQNHYYTVINANGGINGQPYYISANNVAPSQLTPGGLIVSGPLMGTYFGVGGTVNQLNYGQIDGSFMIGGDTAVTCANDCASGDLAAAEQRQSIFGRASYDLTPDIELYVEASVAHDISKSIFQTDFAQLGGVTVKSDVAFVPASVKALLTANNLTQFVIGTSNQGLPLLGTDNSRYNQRYAGGADGGFHLFSDWKYDLYGATSLSNVHEMTVGNWNTANMANAQDAVLVTAANQGTSGLAIGSFQCRSTLTAPTNGCVPLDRLGIAGGAQPAAAYQQGVNYVEPSQPWRDEWLREVDTSFNITGNPFEDWAGPVSVAFGGEWRIESINGYVPPQYNSGWLVGNYLVTKGHYSVAEGYVEAVVPIMKGMDASGAIRYAAYSTAGGVNTWKLGMNYAPIDDVRLRVTYSHDIRAPGLSELFAAGTARTNSLVIGSASYGFLQSQTGNPNLTPEAANTLGLGVVLTPSFIPGLQASVDYFNINIAHEIGTISVQNVANLCYINGLQNYCSQITSTGSLAAGNLAISTVAIHPINYSAVKQEGIDFDTTYTVPLDEITMFGDIPGAMRLHGLATHYMRSYTNDGFDPTTDAAGNNANGNLNAAGSVPDWYYKVEAIYSTDPWTFDLIGRGVSAGKVQNEYIQCTTACPLSNAQDRTINNNNVPGAFYIDTTLNYGFKPYGIDTELFFTVKNLFNTPPVLIPLGGGSTASSTVAVPQTNPTYYDTLGRIFRVGIRANL